MIAGNHELSFDEDFYENNWKRFTQTYEDPEEVKALLKTCSDYTYLEDEEVIVEGFRIYGSPWYCSQLIFH